MRGDLRPLRLELAEDVEVQVPLRALSLAALIGLPAPGVGLALPEGHADVMVHQRALHPVAPALGVVALRDLERAGKAHQRVLVAARPRLEQDALAAHVRPRPRDEEDRRHPC